MTSVPSFQSGRRFQIQVKTCYIGEERSPLHHRSKGGQQLKPPLGSQASLAGSGYGPHGQLPSMLGMAETQMYESFCCKSQQSCQVCNLQGSIKNSWKSPELTLENMQRGHHHQTHKSPWCKCKAECFHILLQFASSHCARQWAVGLLVPATLADIRS